MAAPQTPAIPETPRKRRQSPKTPLALARSLPAEPSEAVNSDAQPDEVTDEAARELRDLAALRAQAQKYLDVFYTERIPIDYGMLVAEAYRRYVARLIADGVIPTNGALVACLREQVGLLRETLNQQLVARDELALRASPASSAAMPTTQPTTPGEPELVAQVAAPEGSEIAGTAPAQLTVAVPTPRVLAQAPRAIRRAAARALQKSPPPTTPPAGRISLFRGRH